MEILRDQKIIYLTRRQTEVEQLKKSLDENSFEMAEMVGHRLKGHGETFGFPLISSIGVTIELAAKERNIDKLKNAIISLDENINENIKLIKKT